MDWMTEFDPKPGALPRRVEPRAERVLHVHLKTPQDAQVSRCEALKSLGPYKAISWRDIPHDDLQRHMYGLTKTHQPTLVFMQLQTGGVVDIQTLKDMRRAGPDDMKIVSWCGDIGRPPDWSDRLAPYCDLMCFSSMNQVHDQRARGHVNAAYLQIGYDEGIFYESRTSKRKRGVVFFGQNYNNSAWTYLERHDAQLRRDTLATLGELGVPCWVYGQGWGTHRPTIAPTKTGNMYRDVELALSISLVSHYERYTSDRLFRAMACGTPTLVKRFADCDGLGLSDEENCLLWDTIPELVEKVYEYTGRDFLLRPIGAAGAELVRTHHTWPVRMRELAYYLELLRS